MTDRLSHLPACAVTSPSSPSASAPISLSQVRRLFAEPTQVAPSQFLRREVASRMQERLALIKIDPACVVDAGCGEGADFAPLRQRFPQARILGVDASLAMLQAGLRQRQGASSAVEQFLKKVMPFRKDSSLEAALACADFARLPLANGAVDVLWSNLALHWHPQPDLVFAEWRRALRVDGLLMFSCFGPDTFKEVRAAFAQAGPNAHVLPFVDMHDYGDMLGHAGFATPVMDMEMLTVTYDKASQLMDDVRAFGGNPLQTRLRGLYGKRAWLDAMKALEGMRRPDGKLALSFEVLYGHAFRAAPKVTSQGETIVQMNLPYRRK